VYWAHTKPSCLLPKEDKMKKPNDIYNILNTIKTLESKDQVASPQPSMLKTLSESSTPLAKTIRALNEKYMGFEKTVSNKLKESDPNDPNTWQGPDAAGAFPGKNAWPKGKRPGKYNTQTGKVSHWDDRTDTEREKSWNSMLEAGKPDYIDLDKDGDKKEPMKKAAANAKEKNTVKENAMAEGSFRDVDNKTGERLVDFLEYHADGIQDDHPELGDALFRARDAFVSGKIGFKEVSNIVLDVFDQGEWQRAEFIKKFATKKVKRGMAEEYKEVVPTTHEDPLVTVHDKDGIHTHANLSVVNRIFNVNVDAEDVHAGPVVLRSGWEDRRKIKIELSPHHDERMKKDMDEELLVPEKPWVKDPMDPDSKIPAYRRKEKSAGDEIARRTVDRLNKDAGADVWHSSRVSEGEMDSDGKVAKLLARFEQNAMELGAYGNVDVDAVASLIAQGDYEGAADEVYGSYADDDGGEVPRLEPMIDDLQAEFEQLGKSMTEAGLDMNLFKGTQGAMAGANIDPESERNKQKPYGYRSDAAIDSDDDYDEWGNPKKKRMTAPSDGPKKKGRPRKNFGPERTTANAYKHKGSRINLETFVEDAMAELDSLVVMEKLTAKDPAGEWISDFVHSDDPKFTGKSKEERKKQALGAYYAAKRDAKKVQESHDLNELARLAGLLENEDEEAKCNHTKEGKECPVHGLKECGSMMEGVMSEIDMELQNIAASGDEEELIDALGGLKGSELQMVLQDMMDEVADELAAKGMTDVINDEDKMIEMLFDKIVDNYSGDDLESMDDGDVLDMKEADMEEGNEFSGALAQARASGAEEFEVDGKTYKVNECGMGPDMPEEKSGMNINSSLDTRTGNKTLSVTAQGDAAEQLARILKMAGLAGGEPQGMDRPMEEYANEPDEKIASLDAAIPSGDDLHKKKTQYADKPKLGDNPMATKGANEIAEHLKRMYSKFGR